MLAFSALGETDYYTWVDENGVTNYAEKKPAGYQYRYVTSSNRFGYRNTSNAEPEDFDEPAEQQAVVDPDEVIAEERAKFEAALAEEKRFNCDIGKKNLTRLETFARIRIKDDDEVERLMTSDEIDLKKIESRTLIKENCKA
jgi:hypothetical protein